MSANRFAPLSHTELASFSSQMALILKSGISSLEGVSILLEDTQDTEEKELLSAIYETLSETGSFCQALSDTGAFPSYFLHMIQIGEQAGRLDEVTGSLAEYYGREAALAQTVKNAVTYPLIMILMMFLVIIVLITQVMPVFNQVFAQLGSEMTGVSGAILKAGEFLDGHFPVFVCILAALAVLCVFLFKTQKGKQSFASFLGRFPGTRGLSDKISSYRFASGMALTLSSGLTPEECLGLATGLVEQGAFHGRLLQCQEDVAAGKDLCEALLRNGIFSGVYARMASIGSKTGVMDEVMPKIASLYEEDIDTRISGLIAAVEPTLVIILSVIVGAILLSVMLPLMGILAGL